MAVDNKAIAEGVLAAVGGPENVGSATHCMTRLRLTVKDKSLVDEDATKAVKGVLGAVWAGPQFQVIIGQNVPKVYAEVTSMGVAGGGSVDENLDDAVKEPLTPKKVWNNALDFLSGSMVQLIPLMMAGGLFRTFAVVLGPTMLNVLAEDSAAYIFFNTIMYDAAFYFLPIYLGFCACRKIGATPVLGALMGGILISPGIIAAASEGGSGVISVYGIEIAAANYSQSVLPIMLSVPCIYFIEKWIKMWMPDALSTIFTPFLTMVIVVPISLIILAPLGALIGNGIGAALFGLADFGGVFTFLVMAVIGALWQLFVVAGMHMPIIMVAIVQLAQAGMDPVIFVSTNCAMWAVWGCVLGAALRLRDKEEKSLCWGYLVAAVLGGVTEPGLFGVVLRYRRTMLGMFAGGAAGAVLSGLLGVVVYPGGGATNFLIALQYMQGGTQNLICMLIGAACSIVVACIVVMMFGFTAEELGTSEEEAEVDAVVPGTMDY